MSRERFEYGWSRVEGRVDPYPRPLDDEAVWRDDFRLPLHWAWTVALGEAIEREAFVARAFGFGAGPLPNISRLVLYIAVNQNGQLAENQPDVLVQRYEGGWKIVASGDGPPLLALGDEK